MSRDNFNRYEYILAPITDIDGKPLYYEDVCQFTWKEESEIRTGSIIDSGNDYETIYAFLVKDVQSTSYPIASCNNIRLIDSSKRYSNSPITKVIGTIDKLKKKLLDCGWSVEDHAHGLLVNGKYIVANRKRKWKVVGKSKWYWYRQVKDLKKYFR